jgi:transcriptional regulator with XRE-family HTH domain
MKTVEYSDSGLSNKIHSLRKEKGMTQQALADVLEVQKGVISRIERKAQDPSDEILKKIAERFNVTVEWLSERSPPIIGGSTLEVQMLKEKIVDQQKIISLLEESLRIAKLALGKMDQ